MGQNEKKTHIAVPLAGSCKLHLSKGISWLFRGVLHTFPLVHDGCAEIISNSHRGMVISRSPALTQCTITERGGSIKRHQENLKYRHVTIKRLRSQYLKESSTKVLHTRFLMILGIQL